MFRFKRNNIMLLRYRSFKQQASSKRQQIVPIYKASYTGILEFAVVLIVAHTFSQLIMKEFQEV
jgi:hypothetical protein